MNSIERVMATLERKPVDQVPFFEWVIDPKVIDGIMPGTSLGEFVCAQGLDAIHVDLNWEKTEVEPGLFRTELGNYIRYNEEQHSYSVGGCISSMKDLEKYVIPPLDVDRRFKTLDETIARYGDQKAIIVHLNDVFSFPTRLMGYEELLYAVMDEPELVEGLVELSVHINSALAREVAKRGVKIVMTGDDYAYNLGPMMSPDTFRELFYPNLCRVVSNFKDQGLHVIKHTDGNIMPIVDMIVDAGFECLDPLEPVANMDLAYMKKTYGSRVALKGNVDCSYTLCQAPLEQVRQETRRCLEVGSKGGGYILSSSNSIHSAVRPENFAAMIETYREFKSTYL